MRGKSHKLVVDVGEDPVSAESFIVPPEILKALPGIQWSESFSMIVRIGIYHLRPEQSLYTSLESAKAEKEALVTELTALQARIARMEKMQAELDALQANPSVSRMGSYNNSKAELDFLNELLDATDEYTVTFTGVTRDGDQVRRNFNLKYTVQDFATAERLLRKIYGCDMRCLIGDISYTRTRTYYNTTDRLRYARDYYERVTVTATATFYETMVGGTADAGLPASEKAAS